MIKKVCFFIISFSLITALCVTHCWLGWRTFSWNGDSASMILLNMSGWHPAIVSYMLRFVYIFTGVHVYPLLLLQVIPFYIAIFILIWAVFKKYNTFLALGLILPFFIRQLYLMPVELMSSSFSLIWTFLLYSVVLYGVLNPEFRSKTTKWIYLFFVGVLFCIALISRQNAIIQVWPVILIGIGIYLNKFELTLWSYLKRFIGFSFLGGLFCIVLNLVLTSAISHTDNGNVLPATPTFLHQIAGSCLPDMDITCFDENWFVPEWKKDPKKWERLKEVYDKNLLFGDALAASWIAEKPFPHYTKFEGLYQKWIYAITKHPYNFWIHVKRFYEFMWTQDWKRQRIMRVKVVPDDEFERGSYHTHPVSEKEQKERHKLAKHIEPKEFRNFWNAPRKKIGRFLEKYIPTPSNLQFIILNFILFVIAVVLWLYQRRNTLFLFFLSITTAGFLSNLLIPLFTPTIWFRYSFPIYMCGTISVCIFFVIAFPKIFIFLQQGFKKLKERFLVRKNKQSRFNK